MNEPKRKFNWLTDTPIWLPLVLYVLFSTLSAIGVGAFILCCIRYAKT